MKDHRLNVATHVFKPSLHLVEAEASAKRGLKYTLFTNGVLGVTFLATLMAYPEVVPIVLGLLCGGLLVIVVSFLSWKVTQKRAPDWKIALFADHFLYRDDWGKERRVSFGDLYRIDGRSRWFQKGVYRLHVKNGKSVSFRMGDVHRLQGFIDILVGMNRSLLNEADSARLRAKAVITAHNLERWKFFFGSNRLVGFLFFAGVPYGVTHLLHFWQKKNGIVHSVMSYSHTFLSLWLYQVVAMIAAYLAIQFFMNRKMRERLKANPFSYRRDAEGDARIFRRSAPIGAVAILLGYAVFFRFDLNLLDFESDARIGQRAGSLFGQDYVWINQRFNCVGCLFSLKEGDVVSYFAEEGWTVGKIVALPGAAYRIGGGELKIVRPGQMVVQALPDVGREPAAASKESVDPASRFSVVANLQVGGRVFPSLLEALAGRNDSKPKPE